MSFEVYLQSHHDGAFAGLPETSVREAFGSHLSEESDRIWRLRYDAENESVIYVGREPDRTISSLMVERPCGDGRLWDALFRVMELGNVVFFFPGGTAPAVAHGDAGSHLPRDMVDALGAPQVVASGSDLYRLIQEG
ncbi:hypothetical protein ABI59_10090 [Acidobacteria bacterium Mor1]|nr:hypothetical protein ABI59_10090 [Acidobacteria bacterium Mor1]